MFCVCVHSLRSVLLPKGVRAVNMIEYTETCWLWKGPASPYPHVRGKPLHRVVASIFHGEPTVVQMDCCHTCDVRNCIRPEHLFWGTREENMRDASRKGRVSRTHQATQPRISAEENRQISLAMWAKRTLEERQVFGEKVSQGKKVYWAGVTPERRREVAAAVSKGTKAQWARLPSAEKQTLVEKALEGRKKYWANVSPERRKEINEAKSRGAKERYTNRSGVKE